MAGNDCSLTEHKERVDQWKKESEDEKERLRLEAEAIAENENKSPEKKYPWKNPNAWQKYYFDSGRNGVGA